MSVYKARFNCPGCGSPLETVEGTISIRCSFCALVMRIGAPGKILKYYYYSKFESFSLKFSVEKHLKENDKLTNLKVIDIRLYYLPFYRFRGMSYTLVSEKIIEEEVVDFDQRILPSRIIFHQKCRHFDLTIPAFETKEIGLDTLGVRPEVMPLNVMTVGAIQSDAALLDLVATPEDARKYALGMRAFNLGISLEGKEHVSSEMIGEGLAVIYYPVWALNAILGGLECTYFIDGLSGRVINEIPGRFEYSPEGKDLSRSNLFSAVTHRCPNCGAELPVSDFSLVYYCANCRKSFIIDNDAYRLIRTRSARLEMSDQSYPFWLFAFSVGNGHKSVGEFARLLTGEIPLIAKDKASQPFYLFVPAFKTPDLESLTTKCIRLNRTQPILEIAEEEIIPAAEMILPESEAVELAAFYWTVMKSKYRHLNAPAYDFKKENIGQGELIWLTFAELQSSPFANKGVSSTRAL
jgi:LSD1 subclass zinc finger protein